MEFTFCLKYQLLSDDINVDTLIERLAEEGCDDALVGVGQRGRLALEFIREASTAEDAILTALKDVSRAVPQCRLIEVTPDLVGLTDVADVIGMSRQNMRKLVVTHFSKFPTPVHEGNAAIWHLAEVLTWLQSKGSYTISQMTLDVARVAMHVNIRKEHQRITNVPGMQMLKPLGRIDSDTPQHQAAT